MALYKLLNYYYYYYYYYYNKIETFLGNNTRQTLQVKIRVDITISLTDLEMRQPRVVRVLMV